MRLIIVSVMIVLLALPSGEPPVLLCAAGRGSPTPNCSSLMANTEKLLKCKIHPLPLTIIIIFSEAEMCPAFGSCFHSDKPS